MEKISNDEAQAIYHEALEEFGQTAQIDMAIEECAELIHALSKYKRNRDSTSSLSVQGEMADVTIMLEQLRIIFGNQVVDEIRNDKLIRLRARINKFRINVKYGNSINKQDVNITKS